MHAHPRAVASSALRDVEVLAGAERTLHSVHAASPAQRLRVGLAAVDRSLRDLEPTLQQLGHRDARETLEVLEMLQVLLAEHPPRLGG